MESTSNSTSAITQTKFVQVIFGDCVQLSDLWSKGSSGPLLSRCFTVDGFVPLFTAIHAEVIIKAVLTLLGGEFTTFLKWGTTLSLGSVNFCVTVFCR